MVINPTMRMGESGTHVTELLNQVRERVLEDEFSLAGADVPLKS